MVPAANIHSGHRARMRKRYMEQGGGGFADHELLELLLYYSVPRRDTNAIAHELISRYGSIYGVFEASIPELKATEGLTENSAVLIKLMLELARRYVEGSAAKHDNDSVDVLDTIAHKLIARCIGLTVETLFVVCLDNRLKVLSITKIGDGTPDSVSIICRKIAELAIRHNAASVIIAHNHPKGFAIPSKSDLSTTVQLNNALSGISIKLLDHIIIAGNDYVSLAQSGIFTGRSRGNFDLSVGFPEELTDIWSEEEFNDVWTEDEPVKIWSDEELSNILEERWPEGGGR